ncbi:MAG: hypothetical protein U0Q12_04710 [Vicinamibacterales bacterium]
MDRLWRRLARTSDRRLLAMAAVAVFSTQLAFTSAIRFYVVPHLTPAAHWRYGLQRASDSEFFQTEAQHITAEMRSRGWAALTDEVYEGLSHAKILASIYYVTGSDHPFSVYAGNALLSVVSASLLFAVMRLGGLGVGAACGLSVLLASGPLFLFVHSELLREPFIVPTFLSHVLGLMLVCRPRSQESALGFAGRLLAGAVLVCVGFVGASTFRPYLMLPMVAALLTAAAAFATLPPLVRATTRPGWPQLGTMAATMTVILGFYVLPQLRGVQQYTEQSSAEKEAQLASASEGMRASLRAKIQHSADASGEATQALEREDLLVPHVCSVQWRTSKALPAQIDRKLESLACARQDFLRFCDPELMATRADRNCDYANLDSASAVLWHVPFALQFGLLAPYPNMWFDSFGGGGTGLRRVGYVVDGLVAYALLPGMLWLVLFSARRRPDLLAILLGLLAMTTVYALAVPSQFILSRMRLSMFLAVLALCAIGWGGFYRAIVGRLDAHAPTTS